LTDDALAGLLNKKLDLWLCVAGFNPNLKKPQGSGDMNDIIAFTTINKRAAAPAVAVNYRIGAENNEFVLTRKGSTISSFKNGIEIGRENPATGRTVCSKHFGKFYGVDGTTNGIKLTGLVSGKQSKAVYFIRTAPQYENDVYTAASKPKKISVKGLAKPTNRKINYKTEMIKLRKDDMYSGAQSLTVEAKSFDQNVSAEITNGREIRINRAATDKKPATVPQVIRPIRRATLSRVDDVTIGETNKKLALSAIYEVFNPATEKWGKLPKVTTSTSFDVRIKSTAKVTAAGATGSAASVSGKLNIGYDTNGKLHSAVITP